LLQIEQGETISAVIPVEDMESDEIYLNFMTKQGITKRSPLSAYSNIRKGGLFAINLREEDELMGVRLTDGTKDIIVGTKQGMSIRYQETDVRSMGRTATGVKAITLGDDDAVVGMEVLDETQDILIVTDRGYGKRTPMSEYRLQSRGGKGIKTVNITEKNGPVVTLKTVTDEEDLMIITAKGIIIRMNISGISQMGRNTQGVRLMTMNDTNHVATVAVVEREEETDELLDEEGNPIITEGEEGIAPAEETTAPETDTNEENNE